jgi:hypothetical protein
MTEKFQDATLESSRAVLLKRIAETLNCEADDIVGTASVDLNETSALLGMWMKIEDKQDRLKVLAFVRTVSGGFDTEGESQ